MSDAATEYFTPDELKMLHHLCDRIAADVEWCGRRLVVEVWDRADTGAVAWVEMYPDDSSPTVRFAPDRATSPDEDGVR